MGRVQGKGQEEGNKRGGFSVPSRAWGVGQEHGSLCGDIHLHPSAHLLSASRCQDNLLAAQAQLSSDGRGRRKTDSFFLRDRGRDPAEPIKPGLCPQLYPTKMCPPPTLSQARIGSRSGLEGTIIQGQTTGWSEG